LWKTKKDKNCGKLLLFLILYGLLLWITCGKVVEKDVDL